jgi:hypothetical protein
MMSEPKQRGRSPGFWSRWLAIKSLATGLVMVPCTYVAKHGLNVLAQQREGMDIAEPAVWLAMTINSLIFLPLPGVLLAIAALTFKSARLPLAVLSMACTLICTLLLVAALVGSLAPFYQLPADLAP